MDNETRKIVHEQLLKKPVKVSASKKKGDGDIVVAIEGDAISIMAMSIVLLKNVGRILKNTDDKLYSAWAVRLISALADTANDEDDEE